MIIYFICMKLNRREAKPTDDLILYKWNLWSITNLQVALLSYWLTAMDGWKEPYKSDRKLGSPRLFWMTCVFSRIASLLLVLELVSGQLSALMLILKAVDSKWMPASSSLTTRNFINNSYSPIQVKCNLGLNFGHFFKGIYK